MKVLDSSFLMDYEDGLEATKDYLLANQDEEFAIPSVVYAEFMLGAVHSTGPTDLSAVQSDLDWADVHPVGKRTAVLAAEVADEIEPQGPQLKAVDALVAGVARELGGTVVSSDRHHTHPETQKVLAVDEYL